MVIHVNSRNLRTKCLEDEGTQEENAMALVHEKAGDEDLNLSADVGDDVGEEERLQL
jgi:hypothetical protein